MTSTDSTPKRRIRSFVRREGRITHAQQQAFDHLWPRYGLAFQREKLVPQEVFGRRAPVVLDIGPGMGQASAALARARPEWDYLAIEVHRPGIGSLLRFASELETDNLRIISHDAVEVIEHMLPDNLLSRVLIFFPDPWPKKRHHKRRLLNPGFTRLLLAKLQNHARVHVSTDWADYADEIPAAFESQGYINLVGSGHRAPRPHWRVLTRFEARGIRQGHAVHDFIFSPPGQG